MSSTTNSADGPPLPPPPESYPPPLHGDVRKQHRRDVWNVTLAIRVLCAFCCLTFFQPDEYFQSLEPAWNLVWGPQAGAWITWEWTYYLRSAIHPVVMAGIYQITSRILWIFGFPYSIRTQAFILAPRLFHGFCTAVMDFATWRLAARFFGEDASETTAAIFLSLLSPWHWFAGPRSLVNGLEACLTTLALVHWPWSWIIKDIKSKERFTETESLRYAVIFAALASALRPTNVLIWAGLFLTLLPHATRFELTRLTQDAVIYGTIILTWTVGIDRLYYGVWTLPAARFLYFNLAQDLAVFYGSNRLDYYFTEGLPILLTVELPFAVLGCYRALTHRSATPDVTADKDDAINPTVGGASHFTISKEASNLALRALAVPVLAYPIILSLISHKEVRFLYPIIAPLLVLAARPFASFFRPLPWPASSSRQACLLLFFTLALTIAIYTSVIHQRGPTDVLAFLRNQFLSLNSETLIFGRKAFHTDLGFHLGSPSLAALLSGYFTTSATTKALAPMSAAFLMPCHSTPWRSHLAFPELRAWALTCEPPIGLPPAARAAYVDEADVFYENPAAWLRDNMLPPPKSADVTLGIWHDNGLDWRDFGARVQAGRHVPRPWPRHVVFFAQLEPALREVLGNDTAYEECWRGFNSHVHDDWRRRGDIVVYCVGGVLNREELTQEHDEITERAWEDGQRRKIEEMERRMAHREGREWRTYREEL